MASISLKINIPSTGMMKTISFDPKMMIVDACKLVRERLTDVSAIGTPKDCGLFQPSDDPQKGVWLDNARTVEYYTLRSGDVLEYLKKTRPLRVKMMDGSLKTVLIDDSATVAELVKTICERVGISNPAEYSLLDEETDQEKAEASKRRGSISGVMDGEVMLRWLQAEKSLRGQGIKEGTVLTLRLKFWNKQIDQNDPVQLNLICAEARSAILTGAHPVTEGEAIQFAALQAQETFGNFDPAKNKSSAYAELDTFLPREYAKGRGVNEKVIAEFQKLTGLTDVNAKLRYVRLFRSLKTYGVSFFHVKEKVKGKNRLMPRLLGVARESVMRLDERTKEVLKTWPLVTVRRWAASPNSFTLDFGDYAESYYSVQTNEGEAISQLIAGYIDIVLKRSKAQSQPAGKTADIGNEPSTAAARAPQVQHMPGGMQLGQMMPRTMSVSQPQSHTASAAQTSLSKSINATLALIGSVMPDLNAAADLPPIGSDPSSLQWKQNQIDVLRQNASSQVTAIAASAAQVIRRTSGEDDETNYTAVGASVTTISSNFNELVKGVRTLAALLADQADAAQMLGSAKKLASSTQKLLTAVLPEENASRQTLLAAAGDTGVASGEVLVAIGEPLANAEFQEELLTLAKEVATSTQGLVQHVKNVAQKCDDKTLKASLVSSTKQTATTTSQLVACTKTLSSCVTSHIAQEQMKEAAQAVAGAIDAIFSATQKACHDDELLGVIGTAATTVTASLDAVMSKLREGPKLEVKQEQQAPDSQHEALIDSVMQSIELLFSSLGRPADMIKQARQLATASSRLVTGLKEEAQSLSSNPPAQKKVLGSAKKLADATAKMVESAKGAATHANEEQYQTALKKSTEDLREAVDEAFGNVLRRKAIQRLQAIAKQTASGSTQLIAAAQGAASSNRNTASQQQLVGHSKEVSNSVSQLVQAIRFAISNPDGPSAQLGLIYSCQQMAHPASKLVAASKAAVPTIGDQAAALQLSSFAKALSGLLVDLGTSAAKALKTCGSLELDSAADTIRQLSKDVAAVMQVAKSGKLVPLPGETPETASLELGISTKTFGSSMAQLLTAASQAKESYTGVAARDVANALKVVYAAGRGVAAGFQDQRQAQEAIMSACSALMDQSLKLVLAAKAALGDPAAAAPKAQLAQAAKSVQQALGVLFGCLPSVRDVDTHIQALAKAAQQLTAGKLPKPSDSYQKLQLALNENGASLNASATNLVVSSRGGSAMLAQAAKRFAEGSTLVFSGALQIAGATKSKDDQKVIVAAAQALANSAGKFLVAGKQLAAHPEALNAKNQLNVESRNVTESINALLSKCVSTTPGQKECENVLRSIEGSGSILENISEPVTDMSFLECQRLVQDKATTLGASMAEVPAHVKKRNFDKFGDSVTQASDCITCLLEAAAQAAYLIGVSDPSSIASQPGLVDSTQTAQAQQAIQNACDVLLNPASRHQQILGAATTIAKHTSGLCTTCKNASQRTRNEVAKHNFVQSAKDIASATGTLVTAIKGLASGLTDENRATCKQAISPLLEAVEKFIVFAASPEFASVAAKISQPARANMRPITEAARGVMSSSVSFVNSAKSLCANADDAATWQLLAMHSKNVTEAIKRLLEEIVSKAPGQQECEAALSNMVRQMNLIDQATLGAISSTLQPRAESTLEGFREQAVQALNGVQDTIGPVVQAATSDPTKLGHTVTLISMHCEPMVSGLIGVASKTKDANRQTIVLNQTKTVTECLLELMTAAKKAGGNSSAVSVHADVVQAGKSVRVSVEDMVGTVQTGMASQGTDGPIATLRLVMDRLDDALALEPEKSFVEYQEAVIRTTRKVAIASQDIVGKASTDPANIAPLLSEITNHYAALGADARNALAACEQEEIAARILKSCKSLGDAIGQLISHAGAVLDNPSDPYYKRELGEAARTVSQQVSFVLAALQAGSCGTQACMEAMQRLAGVTGDLETTCMFADAGTLTPDGPNDQFSDHRDMLMGNAKSLVEDTKQLVASAAGTQDQLATAAQNIMSTVDGIANAAKNGAGAIGPDDKEAQVMVLNAAKDVSVALSGLLLATKNASGKSVTDPEMGELKSAAKVMIGSVSSLIKTVKLSDDEAARGGRGMETAIEACSQELQMFNSSEPPTREASPEDLIHATKAITMTTTRAISAGNSVKQSEVLHVAQLARKAVSELLVTAKAAAAAADNEQHGQQVRTSTEECVKALLVVMNCVLAITGKQSYDKKQKLPELCKGVAVAVSDVIQAAEVLKGTDWVNPDDPNVQAENELLAAASAIEAAAKKLTALRPREEAREADITLNFHEQIVEAAKAITAATGALVKSATQAQRELVASGAMSGKANGVDEFQQWSQGLVIAAKTVSAATNSLCEAANAVVEGGATEERLIASSKAVAKATAQLLVSCMIKADPTGSSIKRLQEAGQAVKSAAENLVKAAQNSVEAAMDEEVAVKVSDRQVGGIAQEIEAQEAIFQKERELELAKRQLNKIRQGRYKVNN